MTSLSDAEKRQQFLQYLNTSILSVILGLAMVMFVSMNNVKATQITMMEKIVKLEVIQQHNVTQVDAVDDRVKVLELNFTNELKRWVDENYVRKQQK